jgi:AraC family transcriptional regulator, transcriptional activator of pobA
VTTKIQRFADINTFFQTTGFEKKTDLNGFFIFTFDELPKQGMMKMPDLFKWHVGRATRKRL